MPGHSPQAVAQTDLSPDLQRLLAGLADSDRHASEVVQTLSDRQMNWRPSDTEWSIAQCLDHLAKSNEVYAAALQRAIGKPRHEAITTPLVLRPGVVGHMFIRTLEPPPARKLRAPKMILPCDRIDKDEVLRKFLASEDAIRVVIRNGGALDLNRIRFKNPFFWFLRFTVGTGLLIIAAHNRRHFWQAQALLENPSFPKSGQ
jgi:hypothetical protein